VVSHLHLATDRGALGAAAVSAGGADLYLSGDLLQAGSAVHLAKVQPGRTRAVVDDAVTPTAAMLQGSGTPLDVAALRQAIVARVGEDRVAFVPGRTIAETVFANHLLANVVLVGAAFQLGGLPVTLADVESAMAGLGPAADENRAAFAWGRWAVHDPGATAAALAAVERDRDRPTRGILDPSSDAVAVAKRLVARRAVPAALHDLLVRRAAQVVDYQSAALARRYLDLVARAATVDGPQHDWALTRAVAESWCKLLTYKDEYEVARLHLAVDYDRVARDLGIDGPYTVKYHLHPPILRRWGLRRKLPLGRPYELAFRALRPMRGLRGTALDPFGRDPDRRLERTLIVEYEQLIDRMLRARAPADYDERVRLAASPMAIKGYGDIKARAAARWREAVAEVPLTSR
jgi:indolepyruvate ferredoxin oxidoreductase